MNSTNSRNDGTRYDTADERIDECLYLLSDGRRRQILSCLDDGEATSVDELARRIEVRGVDERNRTDASTSLYHVHLPKLASGDLVEFYPDRGRVEKTEWPPLVADLVRRID